MKYPIGTKLRKSLAEYEVIGHATMKPPLANYYLVLGWDVGNSRGYDVLQWDAGIIDNTVFAEVTLPEDVSRETT